MEGLWGSGPFRKDRAHGRGLLPAQKLAREVVRAQHLQGQALSGRICIYIRAPACSICATGRRRAIVRLRPCLHQEPSRILDLHTRMLDLHRKRLLSALQPIPSLIRPPIRRARLGPAPGSTTPIHQKIRFADILGFSVPIIVEVTGKGVITVVVTVASSVWQRHIRRWSTKHKVEEKPHRPRAQQPHQAPKFRGIPQVCHHKAVVVVAGRTLVVPWSVTFLTNPVVQLQDSKVRKTAVSGRIHEKWLGTRKRGRRLMGW